MRQTGDKPIVALDTMQRLAMNNLHVLVPHKNFEYNIRYFLGILNSSLLTWFYRGLNPEAGEALAEVKRTNVAALPIRCIDFSNRADTAMHDKMVVLVEKMLSLRDKLISNKNPQSRKQIEAQIEITDEQINELVYNVYGLSSSELLTINLDHSGLVT